jgi:hypothetical protein
MVQVAAPNRAADRRAGKTLDCPTGTFCLRDGGHSLLHRDRDFDRLLDLS